MKSYEPKKYKFDFEIYRENYDDLKGFDNKTLINHYMNRGRFENRTDSNLIYSYYPDFNINNYKKNYPELTKYSDKDIERHWMIIGRHNNLTYKIKKRFKNKVIFIGDFLINFNNLIENSIWIAKIESNYIFKNCIMIFVENLELSFLQKNYETNLLVLNTLNMNSLDKITNINYFKYLIVKNTIEKDFIVSNYNFQNEIIINHENIKKIKDETNEEFRIGIIYNDSNNFKKIVSLVNLFNLKVIDENEKDFNYSFIIDNNEQFSENLYNKLPKNCIFLVRKTLNNIHKFGSNYLFYYEENSEMLNSIIDKIIYAFKIFNTENWIKLSNETNNKIESFQNIKLYNNIIEKTQNKKQISLFLIMKVDDKINLEKFEEILWSINADYTTVNCILSNSFITDVKEKIIGILKDLDNPYIFEVSLKNEINCYNYALSKLTNEDLILFLNSRIEDFEIDLLELAINNLTDDIKFVGFSGGKIENNKIVRINENQIIAKGKEFNSEYFIDCNFSLLETKLYRESSPIFFNENYVNNIYSEIEFNKKINGKTKCKLIKNNLKTISFEENDRDQMIFCYNHNLPFISDNLEYINQDNFINFKKNNKEINSCFELPIELKNKLIEIKNTNSECKPILLTISESLYPANGGGENWLIDIMKFLEKEYYCIGICFRDFFKNINYTETNHIFANNIHFLQIPFEIRNIIEIIRELQPKVVSHQGFFRKELCKICKILDIKFLTGFCFWNDIFEIDSSFSNINMLRNNYKEDKNFQFIIDNSNSYFASDFMKEVVCQKLKTNQDFNIIPTISHKNHYYSETNVERKYVCILNSHELKGGQELDYLLTNLDIKIPLLGIFTEKCRNFESIKKKFEIRNKLNNINVLFQNKLENIKEILNECKILLVPSIVDETFCRVAYEGMALGLPIISYKTGNLSYLLENYPNNFFIELPKTINNRNYIIDNFTLDKWKKCIEKSYFSCKNIPFLDIEKKELEIKTKLLELIRKPIYNSKKRIGLICPFVDQGLGIQCREYVHFLNSNNFETAVFSFKPYQAIQVDSREWDFKNVYYSNNYRDDITFDEVKEWVFENNIKVLLFPEICYNFMFKKIDYFKCLGIKIIGIVNIETMRYNDAPFYHLIDYFWTNNYSTYCILSNCLDPEKIKLLEFNNSYLPKLTLEKPIIFPNKPIIFSTFGGLNSLIRKNIDKTYTVFKQLENEKYNFVLNIFIQDCDLIKKQKQKLVSSKNIKVYFQNNSYSEIINCIKKSDIIVHMGDHEGLGLGLYEALNCNKALLTINTFPNNELVKHNENGWLVNCSYLPLQDNNEGLINIADINLKNYMDVVKMILNKEYRPNLEKILISNKIINNNYETNFKDLLTILDYV